MGLAISRYQFRITSHRSDCDRYLLQFSRTISISMSDPDPLSLMRSLVERSSPGHAMAYKVEDFARSVYGDKREDVDHIGIFNLVSNGEEVPGFSASDFDTRQFTKPVLSNLLESACSLLFKQCLPYFMQTRKLHDQVAKLEKEAEEEKKSSDPATTSALQLKFLENKQLRARLINSCSELIIQNNKSIFFHLFCQATKQKWDRYSWNTHHTKHTSTQTECEVSSIPSITAGTLNTHHTRHQHDYYIT
eukprot:sb/3468805/